VNLIFQSVINIVNLIFIKYKNILFGIEEYFFNNTRCISMKKNDFFPQKNTLNLEV